VLKRAETNFMDKVNCKSMADKDFFLIVKIASITVAVIFVLMKLNFYKLTESRLSILVHYSSKKNPTGFGTKFD
jgi:hypothetical protein